MAERKVAQSPAERQTILDRLRGRYAHIPAEVSLADELIAQRREEAARERSE